MKRNIIAITGDASIPPSSEKYALALNLGKALIDNNFRIINGGLGGVMEAVSKGGRSSKNHLDGDIIGILPNFNPQPANNFLDIIIPTGIDIARNVIISNSDALIAIGGGAGTLSEIAIAWQLKRLIIAYEIEGWSGKLANSRIDHRNRYPDVKGDKVYGVKNELEAIKLLNELLPKYNKRHIGFDNIY